MMLLHVCRTMVVRSPWKIVSRPSSTSSVKGNLGGQAWLTHVLCLVNEVRRSATRLEVLGGQARLTQVPCLVRLANRGVAILLRGKCPLAVHGNRVKTWRGVKT